MEREKPRAFKVAMIGVSGVGKTSIVTRYARNKFTTDHVATIGTSWVSAEVELTDDRVVLNIWDTAGQEKFRSLIPLYMRNADACVIVFSLVSRESFTAVDEIYQYARDNGGSDVYMVLCGNMSDKVEIMDTSRAEAWAHDHHMPFYSTSAKTGEGIPELFMQVATGLRNSQRRISVAPTNELQENSNQGKCSC